MKLVAGLGNPGSKFAATRHNIGFMVADTLATRLETSFKLEPKFKAEVAVAKIGDEDVLIAKPQTFMNQSGEALQKLTHYYRLTPTDVWVIFDDVDVPFGKLRLRLDGTTGQQGARSVMAHIGSDFVRVRAGISLNDRTRESSEEYVLKPFSPEERERLPHVLARAAEVVLEQLTNSSPEETTYEL